jgi:hypothetical protein
MLIAAPVRPLESFFELFKPRPVLSADKEVALSLNQGSIVCLCDAPQNEEPKIIQSFCFEKLSYDPHPVLVNAVRWTIVSDNGQIFEGTTGQTDLYRGLLYVRPDLPVRHKFTSYGVRVVFKFNLPSSYRLHHLAYLQKYFPGAVELAA